MFEGIRKTCKIFLVKQAIRVALKKPAPSRIPMDRDRAKGNDFFSVRLLDDDDAYNIIAQELVNQGLIGKQWSGDSYEYQISVPNNFLFEINLEITHYYKHVRATYEGPLEFFWGLVTLNPVRFLLKQKFSQWAFNWSTKFRHERMSVLKELVEFHIRHCSSRARSSIVLSGYKFSELSYFERKYGYKAFDHPQFYREMEVIELIFRSLCESNDLEKLESEYKIGPNALKSIADYELDERRHKDSVRHNWLIFVLTFVLACTAIAGVYFQVYPLSK